MKNIRKLKIIFGLVLLAVSAACFVFWKFFKKEPACEVTLYGNIEIRQVDLSFRVSGRLKKVYFEEGDYVKKGEKLAELDFDTFDINLNELSARVLERRAKMLNANDIYMRNLPLCRDFTLSKQQCKNLLTDKKTTLADYELAKAQLQNAKIAREDAVLRAPDDGIITVRITEPGTILNAGVPVYSMSLFKPVWARAYISEEYLGRIKFGQKAYISSDSNPKEEFEAHIGFISPVAEFTPKTVETVSLRTDLVYRLRVIVNEPEDDRAAGLHLYLRQGMPVNIRIPLDEVLSGGRKSE